MLFSRAVYFADAFVLHFNALETVLLRTLPVAFLFTAGTIVTYMWRKLYLSVKYANHELGAQQRKK